MPRASRSRLACGAPAAPASRRRHSGYLEPEDPSEDDHRVRPPRRRQSDYPTAGLKKIAASILKALEQSQAELSVALVGDREMRPLNAKYRKKNKTTDVLSFPADPALPAQAGLLGDVIISVEQAKRQAEDRKTSLRNRNGHLVDSRDSSSVGL